MEKCFIVKTIFLYRRKNLMKAKESKKNVSKANVSKYDDGSRECPYCKEEIKSEAVICKHCQSRIIPKMPKHEGICPYCKEKIQPDAVKCKHCKSILNHGCPQKANTMGMGEIPYEVPPIDLSSARTFTRGDLNLLCKEDYKTCINRKKREGTFTNADLLLCRSSFVPCYRQPSPLILECERFQDPWGRWHFECKAREDRRR
jgi:uncharacterized CHY-type Zn-finger protein